MTRALSELREQVAKSSLKTQLTIERATLLALIDVARGFGSREATAAYDALKRAGWDASR